MESVMKAVLLTRTVVKLGFFIDISFDLKNIVNHDQATLQLEGTYDVYIIAILIRHKKLINHPFESKTCFLFLS